MTEVTEVIDNGRMYSYKDVIKKAELLHDEIHAKLNKLKEDYKTFIEEIPTLSLREGMKRTGTVIAAVSSVYRTAHMGNVSLPDFLTGFNVRQDTVEEITLKAKSKRNAKFQVSYTSQVIVDEYFIDGVSEVIEEVVFFIYYLLYADYNVSVLNERLELMRQRYSEPIHLSFAITTEENKVVEIDDTHLVLKADLEKALRLNETVLGSDLTSNYAKTVFYEEVDMLMKMIKTKRPIVKLLKTKHKLMTDLVGLSMAENAQTVLRRTYHKKAENVKREGEIGYFSEKIEGVNTFALLRKVGSSYEVVLKPFEQRAGDIVNSTVDVVAIVKERTN